MLYLTCYSFILSLFILLNIQSNISSTLQILFFNQKLNMILLIILFFNIRGLPPFIGFFTKWLTLINSSFNQIFIIFFLTISSLITRFIYTSSLFPLISFSFLQKNSPLSKTYFWFILTLLILTPFYCFI